MARQTRPPCPRTHAPALRVLDGRGQVWLECLIGCALLLVTSFGLGIVFLRRYQSYQNELSASPLVGNPSRRDP